MNRLANWCNEQLRRLVIGFLVLLAGAGCGMNDPGVGLGQVGGAVGEGPFGEPSQSALLSPFAGTWVLDVDKTLEVQKADGASDEQIATLREIFARGAQVGGMFSEMTITGNEAVAKDGSEYRFFAMHEHDGKICGKAWHHEDRYDPGDMSKCYARLKLEGNALYLEVKMKDGLPDLEDPDLLSSPLPAEGGSAETCDADAQVGTNWGGWWLSVFSAAQ